LGFDRFGNPNANGDSVFGITARWDAGYSWANFQKVHKMRASGLVNVMTRKEIILLFWDCPYCGHKHIPEPTRRCPGCFWWRDRTVNFYEAPDSVVLSPAEVARYAGSDWICKACGAANPETGEPREKLVCGKCHARQIDLDGGSAPPASRLTLNWRLTPTPSGRYPPRKPVL